MTMETKIKVICEISEDYIQWLIDKGQIKIVYPKQGGEFAEFLRQYKKLQ